MKQSVLMQRVFSDSADGTFSNAIAEKINEARVNGTATYSDGVFDLAFAEVDGGVVIEDKINNQVTYSYTAEDGSTKLEFDQSFSATEPDVDAKRSKGEDGKGNETPDSTLPDVDSPITVGITDKDKAGQGKHFSLTFNGFESEEEAREFSEYINELIEAQDEVLTFSDDELAETVECMSDTEELLDKVARYGYVDDAEQLMEEAQSFYSYALMAEQYGHDTDAMQERCAVYADVANDALYNAEMSQSVSAVFSEMDEDDVSAFFSELDEEAANAIYSAIDYESETGETITFSDLNEILAEQNELNQDFTSIFSDMSEDEVVNFFSEIDPAASVVISDALYSDETITFSELNKELSLLDQPLTAVFSDYSEDDMAEYMNAFSEGEQNLIEGIFSDALENENITYSDYLLMLDQYQTQQMMFSDEDVAAVAENANQLEKASKDLEENPKDTELAKKVKVLADQTLEDAEKAEEAGHDMEDVKKMCAQYSEAAAKCLDDNGVVVPPEGKVVTNITKDAEDKTVPTEVKKTGEGTQKTEKTFSNNCLVSGSTVPSFNGKTPYANVKANEDVNPENKVFSNTTGAKKSSVNPCLGYMFK